MSRYNTKEITKVISPLIDEDIILKLEREAFVDFCQEEKSLARIDHMLKTGKPLRN